VIGLGSASGLGAGWRKLSTVLFPVHLFALGRVCTQARTSFRPADRGALVVLVGLFRDGMAPVIRSESVNLPVAVSETRLLVDSAFSERLEQRFLSGWFDPLSGMDASLGFAVMLRYGGVALAFCSGHSDRPIEGASIFDLQLASPRLPLELY